VRIRGCGTWEIAGPNRFLRGKFRGNIRCLNIIGFLLDLLTAINFDQIMNTVASFANNQTFGVSAITSEQDINMLI